MATIKNRKKWTAFALLSIAVPMTLLATFRMTGVLAEPEIITVEPVSWQMYRPSQHVYVEDRVNNTYTDGEVYGRMQIFIDAYEENASALPFGYRDGIIFRLYVNVSVTKGSIGSILIRWRLLDVNSHAYISDWLLEEYNLNVTDMKLVTRYGGVTYIKAQAIGSPFGLFTQTYWVFTDENTEDHKLEVTLEFTYFNETAYQKILVPIILEMPISHQPSEGES